MSDLKEKLKTEIEQADWDMLRVHHERGALFLVDQKLDLLDVGVAIAEDNISLVKIWLDNKELYQVSVEEVSEFEKNDREKLGDFIIIQPYVLLQVTKGT